MKRRVYSGAPWEKQVAYCRANRVGNIITVSGTTAVDENGKVVGENDIYRQTKYIFEKISRALNELGASLTDVTRTRMFITDIEMFPDVGRAHKEVFEGVDPAATCVEISRLVRDELLIEIEVDGVLESY